MNKQQAQEYFKSKGFIEVNPSFKSYDFEFKYKIKNGVMKILYFKIPEAELPKPKFKDKTFEGENFDFIVTQSGIKQGQLYRTIINIREERDIKANLEAINYFKSETERVK